MSEGLPRRRSKIARCSRVVREQLNRLLDDGKQGPEILAWLNGLPEVVTLIKDEWQGFAVSDNNLSQWFKTGFQDWLRDQAAIEETAAKAELSLRIAKAAGVSMSEGVVAVAAGRIMTELETAEGGNLVKLAGGIARLRGTEQNASRIGIAQERNELHRERLALDKQRFERLAVGNFIDWAENEKAVEIATGEGTREVKMDQLMELMFGPRPVAPG
jgi:hypothetical protein